jgi:hypothetical protein
MPTKRVQKQKQKQRQSVVVNVNLAKAKSKSSAKKSGKKSRSRGSIMMLPPPIYASPLDRLTPGMYNSQGQQIQQRSMEDLLKTFLSNQEKQQTNTGFKSLGGEPQLRSTSSFIPYDDSSDKSFKSLGSAPGSSSVSYNPSLRDDVSEMSDPSYMSMNSDDHDRERLEYFRNKIFKETGVMPVPFQNEERSYLSASEPDYESTAPKFSQNEARVSQKNIYESLKKQEPPVYDTIRKLEESLAKDEELINFSKQSLGHPVYDTIRKLEESLAKDEELINFSKQSLGDYNTPLSFPGMYGPRVPVNKSKQEDYFKQYYD